MANILLVDDEEVILSIVSSLLEVEGHTVSSALGGEKAIEMFKANDYDVMISDIRMSPINGISVLEVAVCEKPNMKNIILTAMRSDAVKKETLGLGAKAFITKPFQPDEFISTVTDVIDGKAIKHI